MATTRRTVPFKGDASYWSVRVGDRVAENAMWGYPEPIEGAPQIAGYLAFYWNKMDFSPSSTFRAYSVYPL